MIQITNPTETVRTEYTVVSEPRELVFVELEKIVEKPVLVNREIIHENIIFKTPAWAYSTMAALAVGLILSLFL